MCQPCCLAGSYCLYLPILTFSMPEMVNAEFKFLRFRHTENKNRRLNIWYGTCTRIVITSEDNFVMSCMSSVKFHMPDYNNLDLTACTVSGDKTLTLEASYILLQHERRTTVATPNKNRCFMSVTNDDGIYQVNPQGGTEGMVSPWMSSNSHLYHRVHSKL